MVVGSQHPAFVTGMLSNVAVHNLVATLFKRKEDCRLSIVHSYSVNNIPTALFSSTADQMPERYPATGHLQHHPQQSSR